jgi:hypothetical protein
VTRPISIGDCPVKRLSSSTKSPAGTRVTTSSGGVVPRRRHDGQLAFVDEHQVVRRIAAAFQLGRTQA